MRAVAAAVGAFGTALVAALILTVIDLYLAGHGYPTLSTSLGGGMSAADLIMLASAFATGALVWWATGRLIT